MRQSMKFAAGLPVRNLQRDRHAQNMLFAIALDVGLVDPHQGADVAQLVRSKRVR
jgi:hypothetical protein